MPAFMLAHTYVHQQLVAGNSIYLSIASVSFRWWGPRSSLWQRRPYIWADGICVCLVERGRVAWADEGAICTYARRDRSSVSNGTEVSCYLTAWMGGQGVLRGVPTCLVCTDHPSMHGSTTVTIIHTLNRSHLISSLISI
jgi:hypothetical protein